MQHRTIGQKADAIATFRYLSVFLMETLARWTPLTPELEVKVLFGRHLWEFAQHADVLGQRTSELRAGLHYTRPPVTAYKTALDEMAGFEATADRVNAVYEVLVPELARRYEEDLRDADPLLDQPTIRIVERIKGDLARLPAERRELLAEVELPAADAAWLARLRKGLAADPEFVDFRPTKEAKV